MEKPESSDGRPPVYDSSAAGKVNYISLVFISILATSHNSLKFSSLDSMITICLHNGHVHSDNFVHYQQALT